MFVHILVHKHHEHHEASYAPTNHFKGLDLHLCSCFVGHGIPPQLKELTSKIPENSLFSERHGRLLNLVNSNIEKDMVKVLFQLFDPLHHCFTFHDYQLVPTLEEFSQLLEIPILHQLPYNGMEREPKPEDVAQALHLQPSDIISHWETRSGVKGFFVKVLI